MRDRGMARRHNPRQQRCALGPHGRGHGRCLRACGTQASPYSTVAATVPLMAMSMVGDVALVYEFSDRQAHALPYQLTVRLRAWPYLPPSSNG